MVRRRQLPEPAALTAEIERGLADVAQGRVRDFDPDRIIARGRMLLTARSPEPPSAEGRNRATNRKARP